MQMQLAYCEDCGVWRYVEGRDEPMSLNCSHRLRPGARILRVQSKADVRSMLRLVIDNTTTPRYVHPSVRARCSEDDPAPYHNAGTEVARRVEQTVKQFTALQQFKRVPLGCVVKTGRLDAQFHMAHVCTPDGPIDPEPEYEKED